MIHFYPKCHPCHFGGRLKACVYLGLYNNMRQRTGLIQPRILINIARLQRGDYSLQICWFGWQAILRKNRQAVLAISTNVRHRHVKRARAHRHWRASWNFKRQRINHINYCKLLPGIESSCRFGKADP